MSGEGRLSAETMPNMPSGSAIPAALANTMAIVAQALPAGSTVYYGSELPAYTAPLTFQISEITGDQVPATLGANYTREENFNLVCSLIAYSGGVPDFVAQLQSLMANFVLLSRAIGNNPWLSTSGQNDSTAAVRFAQVGNFHIAPETDPNGESATTLDFAIRCEQRVTSLT